MITIKRFIHLFILIMLAVIFSGCEEKDVPVSGAALDLQARFEEAFDGSENYSAATGTVRVEPVTEPMSETDVISSEIIEETIKIAEITINDITNTSDDIIKETLEPTKISETIQEEQFIITPSGTRYHVKGCRTAKNIKEYLSREEAKSRGYEPCKICKP